VRSGELRSGRKVSHARSPTRVDARPDGTHAFTAPLVALYATVVVSVAFAVAVAALAVTVAPVLSVVIVALVAAIVVVAALPAIAGFCCQLNIYPSEQTYRSLCPRPWQTW
jgi:uncharacterized membrane protein